jgi:oligopeptide transport system substrate-binding protein
MSLVRIGVPIAVAAAIFAALVWSMTASTMPRADFAFYNGEDVKTVDPARASGQPEGRVIWAIFEGLLRPAPTGEAELVLVDGDRSISMKRFPDGEIQVTLSGVDGDDGDTFDFADESEFRESKPDIFEIYDANRDNYAWIHVYAPEPAVAKAMPEISTDGLTYTFKIREGAKWSNGRQITSQDFAWSWMRQLHPETTGEYKYQLFYIDGAQKYSSVDIEVGDAVEVELSNGPKKRKGRWQIFPQGTIVRGTLISIEKTNEPKKLAGESDQEFEDRQAEWKRNWIYVVDVDGEKRGFARSDNISKLKQPTGIDELEPCYWVLPDFQKTVGIETPDDETLIVTLKEPTAYFVDLVAFYTLSPVCRECVEEHGTPAWTRPDNLVSNGAFKVTYRAIRDRIRMEKSETYWDKDNVHLNVVDSVSVKTAETAFNLYEDGQLDWSTNAPPAILDDLKKREDFKTALQLATYFYRVNVEREGLSDKRVRQALNMAINKQLIVENVTTAGERASRTYVPPGMPPYVSPKSGPYDPERARELFAEAGYPGGAGFPKIEILYNSDTAHRSVAEVIQQQWKNELNVSVELRPLEWGTYLDTVNEIDYAIARAGWIGDYTDPNTFLDMFKTDGEQNSTNWSNKEYDSLIEAAKKEADVAKRRQILYDAEAILMDELPIIPIYYYVSKNLVKPHVKGFTANLQDIHPLRLIRVEKEE